jgi:hypothetical protein
MKTTALTLLFAATLWGYGDGAIYWTPHACDEGKSVAKKHGSHGMGESAMFALMNSDGNISATLIHPDLSTESLPLTANTVMLPKPKSGGYYAMIGEVNTTDTVYSALRYGTFHARPSKISPTKLTALPKADLEIVPDPLHREHDRYTASKTYRFVAIFEDKPLANAPITLETHNTPAQSYTTDAQGVVKITLPNDFKNVTPDRRANKPSEFLVTLQHDAHAKHYVSTFTMPYSANPNDFWQSQEWGAGAVLVGFLGGLLIYRRTQKGAKNG